VWYLKSNVYRNKPRNIQELKDSIRQEIATVGEEILGRAMQNLKERLEECVQKEGRHLTDVIFRKQLKNVQQKLHCKTFLFV
jgi:vacuolar-type H+-ATPase subunit E/Vma4